MPRNISNAARARTAGMSDLALSMALPHERRPVRQPVVPATMTATISTMSDGIAAVSDTGTMKAVVTRSPTYPLWMSRKLANAGMWLRTDTAAGGAAGTECFQSFDAEVMDATASPVVDGAVITTAQFIDRYGALTDFQGYNALYIPPESTFSIMLNSGAAASGTINVVLAYFTKGEWLQQTVQLVAGTGGYANYFVYIGVVGSTPTTGSVVDGPNEVKGGFVTLLRGTVNTTTNSFSNKPIWFGWGNASYCSTGSATSVWCLLPSFPAVEFKNSLVPYTRTRANATAALFTNVTAALYKEGTILAGRLNSGTYNFYDVTEANINTAPPAQRYYGPLEKGLYTFTSPSMGETLTDGWLTQNNLGERNTAGFPRFDPNCGMYHSIIFSDVGSGTGSTQLAVSVYTHLEFEPSSSLFELGVSMQTLEALHAAEIALLKFGHFHENPLHWAAIAAAARLAIKTVAPMIAPYVAPAAEALFHKGVNFITGNKGDRAMQQELAPRKQPKPPGKRNKKVRTRRPK